MVGVTGGYIDASDRGRRRASRDRSIITEGGRRLLGHRRRRRRVGLGGVGDSSVGSFFPASPREVCGVIHRLQLGLLPLLPGFKSWADFKIINQMVLMV